MRVAAIPVGPAGHDPHRLWRQVEAGVSAAAAAGAGLAILPELTVLPYVAGEDPARWRHPAEPSDGPTARRMGALARHNGLALVFGLALSEPGENLPRNAALLAQADGSLIQIAAKHRLPPPLPGDRFGEADHFRPGPAEAQAVRVGFPGGGSLRVAGLVCYDRRFRQAWDTASAEPTSSRSWSPGRRRRIHPASLPPNSPATPGAAASRRLRRRATAPSTASAVRCGTTVTASSSGRTAASSPHCGPTRRLRSSVPCRIPSGSPLLQRNGTPNPWQNSSSKPAGVVTGIKDRDTPVIVENGAVLSRDGVIVAVGPVEEMQRTAPEAELRRYPGHVMLPGFVNSHHHVGLTPLQLGSPDYALELWFASRLPARRLDLTLDTLYSAFEMVASGITTVQHIQGWMAGGFGAIHASATKTLNGYRSLGMRASYCYAVREQNRLVYEADEAFCARLPVDLGEQLAAHLKRRRCRSPISCACSTSCGRKCGAAPDRDPAGASQPPLVYRRGTGRPE